jgi:hypothetical protein
MPVMDGPGFHVEIDVLEAAAAGIAGSVADQERSPLAGLDRGAETYGHEGLHGAMETFCDRWNEGLDILLDDAGAIGDILARAAHEYRAVDRAGAARLTGDPAERVVDD